MIYSEKEKERFNYLYSNCVACFKQRREQTITQISPFSRRINCAIGSEKELAIYIEHNLTERFITRPSLIMRIDPNCCDANGIDNLSKMLKGNPPIDSVTGSVIHLHHIGQTFDAPFAELPQNTHNSTACYSTLHQRDGFSWRNDKNLLRKTQLEIKKYWKMRSEMYL